MARKNLKSAAALAMALTISHHTLAHETAALLIYEGDSKTPVTSFVSEAERNGCSVWLKGYIAGHRGPLPVGTLNQFLLLECTASPDQEHAFQKMLAARPAQQKATWLLGGAITRRDDRPTSPEAFSNRRYILKISDINAASRDGFKEAHDAFMQSALGRASAFRYEAAIAVETATGLPKPDMVELFYYETMGDQQAFLANNPDVVQQSRAFNKKYMKTYSYMAAAMASREE